jgi:1-acyl-sn-glycerol-3-phosphate acyltransferase
MTTPPHTLSAPAPSPLKRLRAALKLALMILSTLWHAALLSLTPTRAHSFRYRVMGAWGRTLTWIMGLELSVEGAPAEGGALLICNHRSYADIPILMGLKPCVFLAKAELRSWPVIGWGAQAARTVFVDRGSPESRQASRDALRARLAEGLSVLVFAEGTTVAQGQLLPLKPGMFHEAAQADLPIQLVSLAFEDPASVWVGDDPVAQNFARVFGGGRVRVRVNYRPALLQGTDGAELCAEAQRWLEGEVRREGRGA